MSHISLPSLDTRPQAAPQSWTCPLGEAQCTYLDQLRDIHGRLLHLEQQLRTDALTGLYNFRSFCETLDRELERSRRNGMPTSLIMLDLDLFKGINDAWGHEMGNLALHHVAEIMYREVRKIDVVCRYGGEEFAIVLPETTKRAAIRIAERVRAAIADTPLRIKTEEIKITASLGVNTFQPLDCRSREAFVEETDQWLYKAKHSGRNCVAAPDSPESEDFCRVTLDEKRLLLD